MVENLVKPFEMLKWSVYFERECQWLDIQVWTYNKNIVNEAWIFNKMMKCVYFDGMKDDGFL